jgi:hypothetical protein
VCTEAKVGKRSARWGRDMEAEVQGRLWRVLKKSALPSAISVQTVVRVHMVLGERVESRCLPTVRFANQVLEEAGCELAEEDAAMNSAPGGMLQSALHHVHRMLFTRTAGFVASFGKV